MTTPNTRDNCLVLDSPKPAGQIRSCTSVGLSNVRLHVRLPVFSATKHQRICKSDLAFADWSGILVERADAVLEMLIGII
jgi:hypothetical protein